MTVDQLKPTPVTQVTHFFVGPLRACAHVRARDADNDEMRHLRHTPSREVHHA